MTINNIKEKYGKGFDYIVVDEDETYWDDCDGQWSASGEFGWFVSDETVEKNGIAGVVVDNKDRLVFIHVDGYLG